MKNYITHTFVRYNNTNFFFSKFHFVYERERERVIIEFEIGYCKGSVIDTLKLYLECRRVQTKSKGNDSILTTSDDFGIQQEVSETCDEK